jgi:hypothetical protein
MLSAEVRGSHFEMLLLESSGEIRLGGGGLRRASGVAYGKFRRAFKVLYSTTVQGLSLSP